VATIESISTRAQRNAPRRATRRASVFKGLLYNWPMRTGRFFAKREFSWDGPCGHKIENLSDQPLEEVIVELKN
jgi:hypothetical protein